MGKLALTIAVIGALAAGAVLSIDRATAISAVAAAKPGMPAPTFSVPDIAGKTVSLANFAGKIIILEWTNDGCPFVGKHYNSGNMQALQRKYTGEGDAWLTIASSAPGEQGYVTSAEAQAALPAGMPLRRIICSIPTAWSVASMTRARPRPWWSSIATAEWRISVR